MDIKIKKIAGASLVKKPNKWRDTRILAKLITQKDNGYFWFIRNFKQKVYPKCEHAFLLLIPITNEDLKKWCKYLREHDVVFPASVKQIEFKKSF